MYIYLWLVAVIDSISYLCSFGFRLIFVPASIRTGSITMKRLMKIFNIKKKAGAERQSKFREVVRELCTMKADKIEGNVLVLKPHYSKM